MKKKARLMKNIFRGLPLLKIIASSVLFDFKSNFFIYIRFLLLANRVFIFIFYYPARYFHYSFGS